MFTRFILAAVGAVRDSCVICCVSLVLGLAGPDFGARRKLTDFVCVCGGAAMLDYRVVYRYFDEKSDLNVIFNQNIIKI